jgi:DNA polymerase-3 subunit beta
MRFNISSNALSSRLMNLSKVINSKNSLPILDSFLFEVHNGQAVVTASDSENVMQSAFILDICEGEGNFAVNNKTILDAVKELPEVAKLIDLPLVELAAFPIEKQERLCGMYSMEYDENGDNSELISNLRSAVCE